MRFWLERVTISTIHLPATTSTPSYSPKYTPNEAKMFSHAKSIAESVSGALGCQVSAAPGTSMEPVSVFRVFIIWDALIGPLESVCFPQK